MYFFNTFHLPYICSGISDVLTTVNYYTADIEQSGDSNIAWIAGIGVSVGGECYTGDCTRCNLFEVIN